MTVKASSEVAYTYIINYVYIIQSQLCAALYSVDNRSDIFTLHWWLSLAVSTPGPQSTSNYTSHSPGSGSQIPLISSAVAGSLLIVAAVGIYWIYRRHRKTDQEGKCYLLLTHL